MFRRILHEPLLHFLLIGALMFTWSAWHDGRGPNSTRIVVSSRTVAQLETAFSLGWGRAPRPDELKLLIDDHVREEIAVREAAALGLERDDVVIRRRLRQKLEFLLVDEAAVQPATDAQLQAWLDQHPQAFPVEPQLAFRQVLIRPDRRGTAAQTDAQALLQRLRQAGPDTAIQGLGDATMLPAESTLQPLSVVERTFGQDFAQALAQAPQQQWAGPLASSYGLHLVWLRELRSGGRPDLASVRPLVEREWQSERRTAAMQALYERSLAKYDVSIETMPAQAAAPGASMLARSTTP